MPRLQNLGKMKHKIIISKLITIQWGRNKVTKFIRMTEEAISALMEFLVTPLQIIFLRCRALK